MRHAILCLVVLPLALAGCDHDHIRIVVTPKPDGTIHREVRIWRTSAVSEGKEPKLEPPTASLLEAPRRVYGEPRKEEAPVAVFRADLPGVPADLEDEGLTNHGGCSVWNSPLGSAFLYRERFPGRTDIHDTICILGEAVDTAAELLAAMVEDELAGEKGADRLATTIRGPLKKDVQNLVTMLLAMVVNDDSLAPAEEGEKSAWNPSVGIMIRTLQYLEERGYVRVQDLPRDLLAFGESVDLDNETIVAWIARGMGREPDEKLTARLREILVADRLEKALERACAKVGIDKKEFEARIKGLPSGLIPIRLVADPAVELVLRTGMEPVECNGRWSPETGEITFATTLDAGHVLAPLAYAAWAVPDREWQTAHLGRVGVDGESLFELTIWENALAVAERQAWHRALDGLDPAKDLAKQLNAIRVTASAKGAERGAQLIRKALRLASSED